MRTCARDERKNMYTPLWDKSVTTPRISILKQVCRDWLKPQIRSLFPELVFELIFELIFELTLLVCGPPLHRKCKQATTQGSGFTTTAVSTCTLSYDCTQPCPQTTLRFLCWMYLKKWGLETKLSCAPTTLVPRKWSSTFISVVRVLRYNALKEAWIL